jgi:hypothetical protein
MNSDLQISAQYFGKQSPFIAFGRAMGQSLNNNIFLIEF